MNKLKVGILGCTGMVGQQFIARLERHPWFEVVAIAASSRSAGKTYEAIIRDRWIMETEIPEKVRKISVNDVEKDLKTIKSRVDMVFSALNMSKEEIQSIEEAYASNNIPVVSNNSAHRWTQDVPMIIPEVNPEHVRLIDIQRKNRNWNKGFIAVKPNCSIQSYVSILTALKKFKPTKVHIVSLQSISGAGRTFDSWPEMIDNIIPYIEGEEEKSEQEPLKIWGKIQNSVLKISKMPIISVTCIRVPIFYGHTAIVSVSFENKPSKEQILAEIHNFDNPLRNLNLPSAPIKLIRYYEEKDRPQTKLDRNIENGMAITMGRLRTDKHFDWNFTALSHNTIRGAAGGAILLGELLVKKGYIGKDILY